MEQIRHQKSLFLNHRQLLKRQKVAKAQRRRRKNVVTRRQVRLILDIVKGIRNTKSLVNIAKSRVRRRISHDLVRGLVTKKKDINRVDQIVVQSNLSPQYVVQSPADVDQGAAHEVGIDTDVGIKLCKFLYQLNDPSMGSNKSHMLSIFGDAFIIGV
jgi:hypothetical protein